MQYFANIIVDISQKNVDRPFSYRIPEALLEQCRIGVCVIVPFGRGNKEIAGYILEITTKTDIPKEKIKDIIGIATGQNAVESKMIELAAWIKEQYGSTMIAALKTVLPVKKSYQPKEKKTVLLSCDMETAGEALNESIRKHQNAKERILKELIEERVLDYQLVIQKLHISPPTINSLQKAGIIRVNSENYFRNPVRITDSVSEKKTLNEEQQTIVNTFIKDFGQNIHKTYLLHGITGSGKTEVYIHMIHEVVKSGKQVIVLIPEIALTYQTVMRFYHYFGERVSVMNSSLSPGEKYDQCERAKRGDIDIIIGPRSALFTPFLKLGLIVIDEEHEPSYKSENMPKYHAREVAMKLGKMHQASIVLGSATPSVDSYYRARQGEYQLFSLKNRAMGAILPKVYTVDLCQELKEGNRSIFSRRLQELLAVRLKKREQSMLFLNRRGYAGFISCRACGHVMKCPHCDVSLSEHRNGKLVCHYCGYEENKPLVCPKCGSKYILSFKAGTEQIEEQLKKLYPEIRVLRMDADTTKQKDSYERILAEFSDGEADVLVGTQMIVKGHDFKNVTLMGILAADLSLAANDYRAGERTFELLTQAAGRAGRGNKEGEVVIQTYQPEHYSVVCAANQDYEAFYEEEILYRELSGYPPVYHMVTVMFSAKSLDIVKNASMKCVELIREEIEKLGQDTVIKNHIQMIGPAAAAISKINDYYREIFMMKSKEKEDLIFFKDILEKQYEAEEKKDYQIQFDFDPMNPY